MLKENDPVAYGEDDIGRVQAAVAALEPNEDHAFIEIETTSAKQALTAALAWSQHRTTMGDTPLVIMLDNLGPETRKEVAAEMEERVREHRAGSQRHHHRRPDRLEGKRHGRGEHEAINRGVALWTSPCSWTA